MTDDCPVFVDPGRGLAVNRHVCAACGRTHPERLVPVLMVWVIFDHPLDCPKHYVVRCQVVVEDRRGGGSRIVHTPEVWLRDSLEGAREVIRGNSPGATCMPRTPEDDPCIVEAWI